MDLFKLLKAVVCHDNEYTEAKLITPRLRKRNKVATQDIGVKNYIFYQVFDSLSFVLNCDLTTMTLSGLTGIGSI